MLSVICYVPTILQQRLREKKHSMNFILVLDDSIHQICHKLWQGELKIRNCSNPELHGSLQSYRSSLFNLDKFNLMQFFIHHVLNKLWRVKISNCSSPRLYGIVHTYRSSWSWLDKVGAPSRLVQHKKAFGFGSYNLKVWTCVFLKS